jgi:hypothetical protein
MNILYIWNNHSWRHENNMNFHLGLARLYNTLMACLEPLNMFDTLGMSYDGP